MMHSELKLTLQLNDNTNNLQEVIEGKVSHHMLKYVPKSNYMYR